MSRPRYVTPRERKLEEEQWREFYEEQRQGEEPRPKMLLDPPFPAPPPVDRGRPAPRRKVKPRTRRRTSPADREEPGPRGDTTDEVPPEGWDEDWDEGWDEDGDEGWDEDWDEGWDEDWDEDSEAEKETQSGWPSMGPFRPKLPYFDELPAQPVPAPPPLEGPPSGRTRRRDDWLDLVLASIPVEIITAWAVIETILETNAATITTRGFWTVFFLVLLATVFHTLRGFHEDADETETRPPETGEGDGRTAIKRRRLARWTIVVQVALAVSSFVVWAYYLAGPFEAAGLYNPTYAAVILPLYTLFGPQLLPILPPYLADFESWVRQRTEGTQATEGTGA